MLSIATNKKCLTANKWTNWEITWDKLSVRLSETTYTGETMAEYLAMPRNEQDAIKASAGGFVGGKLKDGVRKSAAVEYRSFITLDLDTVKDTDALMENISLYGYEAILYSTHKHTPQAPRLRLLLSVTRPLTPDEYEPVCRHVAQCIGMEQVDPVSYRVAQLMYWPTTPKDGSYWFEENYGEPVDVDEILLRVYIDWRDAASWPRSAAEEPANGKAVKEQADPLRKDGVIGAFCRTYSIHEAIRTFLPEVYAPGVGERYTYTAGSSANGLVVYDDVFAYSNHATDPAYGKLLNAFDLVRIHQYAHLDKAVKPGASTENRPSFKAMQQYAAGLKDVKVELLRERMQAAAADFGEPLTEGEEGGEKIPTPAMADSSDENLPAENIEWIENLDTDAKGNTLPTLNTFATFVACHDALRGKLRYNEFERRKEVHGLLPWRSRDNDSPWTDSDTVHARMWVENAIGIGARTNRQNFADAIDAVYFAPGNRYHPVKDYLNGLPEWDGKPRLDRLLVDYFGAEDTPYTHAVTSKTLIAAVARIMKPGVKFDQMLLLIGEQGCGKSRFIQTLGGRWAGDPSVVMDGSKDAVAAIQGKWLVEVSEMKGLRKADRDAVKSFISTPIDRARLAYRREVEEFPKTCVFIGTTNDYAPLNDPTGLRRYWPVQCNTRRGDQEVDRIYTLLPRERDQIWAEALQRYRNGESLELSAELRVDAETKQNMYEETDEFLGLIQEYVERKYPENWDTLSLFERRTWLEDPDRQPGTVHLDRVCISQIKTEVFNYPIGDKDQIVSRRIAECLNKLFRRPEYGETRYTVARTKIYGRQKCFVYTFKESPPPPDPAVDEQLE